MSDTTTTPNPITSTVLKLPMLQEQFSKEFTSNALVSAKKIKTNYGSILKAGIGHHRSAGGYNCRLHDH
jgi:hypothetical protein